MVTGRTEIWRVVGSRRGNVRARAELNSSGEG